MNVRHYRHGDYVFSGIPNSFNGKLSFWISKKGHTVAFYCFSTQPWDELEIQRQLACADEYIHLYLGQLARMKGAST